MFSGGRGSSGAAGGSEEPQQQQQQPVSHPETHLAQSASVDPSLSSSSSLLTRIEILSTRVPPLYVAPFCGASAGVASGIVTCPLDVIKTKLQAQGGFSRRSAQAVEAKTLYRGMLGTGKMILHQDGIKGLYQGLGPLLFGYLPTWAVYLAIYDRSRNYFYEKTGQFLRSFDDCSNVCRQLVAIKRICIHLGRCMLDRGDQSYLGY